MTQGTHDSVKMEGVLKNGYGLSPKMVMKDKRLSIEAKAIYAYMSSYAGHSETAFPSVGLMCSDLGISEARLRKHRNMLVDCGYIEIERESPQEGKFGKNVYTIKQLVPEPTIQNSRMVKTNHTKHHDGDLPARQNVSTNNNSSFNNNSITNNNSNNKEEEKGSQNPFIFYQENGFGVLSSFVSDKLNNWIDDLSEEHVIYAMQIAVENNSIRWNYVEKILKDWFNRNLITLEAVHAARAQFEAQKGGKTNGINPRQQSSTRVDAEERLRQQTERLKGFLQPDGDSTTNGS
ncbi:DnaD domain protein [Solibacillus silvestris]|uniref:DnaD domain protein n=1 Tax=Solibacillus silvestris TaxID=76853 RepID=UPI003F7D57E5